MLGFPALVFDAFSRLAGAIVCAFVALSVWEIGSRSPVQFIRDVARGLKDRPSIVRGVARTLVGLLFASLALALIWGALSKTAVNLFPLYAIGSFVAGLGLEALLGNALRSLFGVGAPNATEERTQLR